MEGQIIRRRNVYTSYGKPERTVVSLDAVINTLRFLNPGREIDREEVKWQLLNGEEIWTINCTYFLKGGKADGARRK